MPDYDTGAVARGVNQGLQAYSAMYEKQQEEEKRILENGRIADSMVKTNPELLQSLGMSEYQFRSQSSQQKAAAVTGYIKSLGAQETVSKLKHYAQQNELNSIAIERAKAEKQASSAAGQYARDVGLQPGQQGPEVSPEQFSRGIMQFYMDKGVMDVRDMERYAQSIEAHRAARDEAIGYYGPTDKGTIIPSTINGKPSPYGVQVLGPKQAQQVLLPQSEDESPVTPLVHNGAEVGFYTKLPGMKHAQVHIYPTGISAEDRIGLAAKVESLTKGNLFADKPIPPEELNKQIDALVNTAKKKGNSSQSSERIKMVHPDGRIGTIPASQLDEALKSGFRKAP